MSKPMTSGLLSGSAIYLISNILNAGIPFILLPVLTRYLEPAEYGEVAMFMTLVAALGAFTGLNSVGAANRKYYDHPGETEVLKSFIGSCLLILLTSTALVFLVIWLLRNPLSQWLGLPVSWVLWAVVASAAGFLFQLRLGQWLIRKQARSYGALQVSQSVVNVMLSLLLVVVLLYGADGRMTGYLVASLLFAAIALLLLGRDDLLGMAWEPAYVREALTFGVPLIPHIAGLFLLNAVDRFVINAELGLSQTGIYMVAVQLAGALKIVFDAFNKAYVPWLYERLLRDRHQEKRQIVRLTYAYFAIALLMAAVVFALGPLVIRLIAGADYAEAATVIGWIALGQAFNGMYLMVTNYIFYSKRTGLLSLATISSGLLNVALLLVLINWLGLVGAGMAYALAMAIRFLLTWWVAQLRHPMPWFAAV